MARKQISIRVDDKLYAEIEKCRQELKKKQHIGGESISKCGEYLIKLGLDFLKI